MTQYWYLGIFAIVAIGLLTQFNRVVGAIKNKIAQFRLRLLFFVSNRLEPDAIATFRQSVSRTFDELSDFLEKTELELLRSRMDNLSLKDKLQELERNREALLEELGGSPDFSSIEFSIWQQTIQVVDLLVSDRLALIQKIELINSYDGNFEALSKDLTDLRAKNQAAEQKISALLDEQNTLRAENGRLSIHNEHLQTRIELLRQAEVTAQMLERKVAALQKNEVNLQHQLDQLKLKNTQLEQQNAQLKQQNDQLEKSRHESNLTIHSLEGSNQGHLKVIASLREEVECLRGELAQKEAQIQQQELQTVAQQENSRSVDSQENVNFQVLLDDHNADKIRELEAEASYWRYQVNQSKEREKAWEQPDYASYSDYLSYVQYWRDHPEYY
jgi:DNA repair exonuclease SbcCD ATPase subunit